jgi:hypothetical protein
VPEGRSVGDQTEASGDRRRSSLQPRVDRLAFEGQDAEDALCGSSTALPDVVAVRVGPPSSNSRLERTVFAAMTATLAVLSAYVAVS